MGSPTLPAAPSAPDYGAASREGVYADIDTLDTRRAIENAARLGKSVQIYNPISGAMEVKDFTGLGDADYARQAADLATQQNETVQRQQLALRQQLGVANVQQTREELRAADPAAFDARMDLSSVLHNQMFEPNETITASDNVRAGATRLADLANAAPTADTRLGEIYKDADASLKSTASDLGQIDQLRALQAQTAGDNTTRQTLGYLQGQAANDTSPAAMAALQGAAASDTSPAAMAALQAQAASDPGARAQYQALLAQSAGSASRNRLGSIYDEATRLPSTVSDPTSATLNAGLAGALADYQLGGKLDDTTRRDLLNEVRAGQVARGNYLGDAAAVVEATELGNAAEQRKAQRLQTVLAAQSQAFGQNSALRDQEAALRSTRLGALTNLQGQDFGQESALRGEQAQLAGLTAQEQQALRAEQAGYAGAGADRTAALRAEQAGYAGAGADRTAALRNEQAGYATGAQGLTNAQTMQLAQLAQQIYGTGASVRGEQLATNSARLGTLAGLAGQDQAAQQQAYAGQLNGAGQAFAADNALAGEERAARAETLGRSQQKLANVSAMVLGQPITNQFGSLAGAQQGAVGFQPIAYQGGAGLNQNAGQQAAGFAQGNYGTASNNWSTSANIAAQGSPWMALAGQVAGGAAGGAGAALGAMI